MQVDGGCERFDKACGFEGILDEDRFSLGCHPLEVVPVALGMFYLSRANALRGPLISPLPA